MSYYDSYSKEELIRVIKQQEQSLKSKKYGLVWDDEKEPEQVVLDCANHLPILKRVKSKEIKEPENNTQEDNILIEGDNYHALSVLNYTHKEKIDVIYIDPPYNTGNKDFKYNDSFVDREDGYRHSKWLNFMEKRLKLARELLKEEGVIFISIDDNEMAQLKLLCDSIFGEENFVTSIKVKVKAGAGVGQESFLQDICEYILLYSKNSSLIVNQTPNIEEEITDKTTNVYNNIIKSLGNDFKINTVTGGTVGNIDIYNHENFEIEKIPTVNRSMDTYYKNFDNIFRTTNPQGGLMKRIMPSIPKNGLVSIEYYPTKGRNKGLKYRYYFYNGSLLVWLKDSAIKDIDNKKVTKLVRNSNLWTENLHQGIANEGGVEFKNGKKPVKLIKKLIELVDINKNSNILDFMAGSGTTAQAVMELNREDGGNRKFILCTNNEGDICTDITYPRIKNVIKGYNNYEGLGGNLQYFKTSLIKYTKNRDQTKINLTHKCAEMICLKENIFNIEAEEEDYKIYSSNSKHSFVCIYFNFIDDSFHDFLNHIKQLKGRKKIYLFSLEDRADTSLFQEVDNFSLEAIPKQILEIYKRLIKMNIPVKPETIFIDLEKAKELLFTQKDKDTSAKILRVVLEKLI